MAEYVHFSARPVRRLVQREIRWSGIKPYGAFWFSDESDYGWLQWCEENEYNSDGLRYSHSIGFTPGTRMLVADSLSALDDLHREYSYIPGWAGSARRPLASSLRRWDYRRLACEYDALIISPYQREHRGERRPYSGWDCASGVVFDVSRVELGPAITRGTE